MRGATLSLKISSDTAVHFLLQNRLLLQDASAFGCQYRYISSARIQA